MHILQAMESCAGLRNKTRTEVHTQSCDQTDVSKVVVFNNNFRLTLVYQQ